MNPPTPAEILAERREHFVAFVQSRVRDRALAEDLVQSVYAHALPKLATLRDDDAVVAWFFRSLRNALLDRHRRRAAEDKALASLESELDAHVETQGGAEEPTACACVSSVAAALKPEYQAALRELEVEDKPVREFAREHGLSAGNAGVRAHRAREALKRGVIARCGHCASDGCGDCTC